MAHARRRFDEALTILKRDFTKEQLKETTAYEALSRIGMPVSYTHLDVYKRQVDGRTFIGILFDKYLFDEDFSNIFLDHLRCGF